MGDELFRNDGQNRSERAVVQDNRNATVSEKHSGPKVGVDFFRDRFEHVEAGKRLKGSFETPVRAIPEVASAMQLKAELAAVVAMPAMTWDLPEWRPAVVSRELLKRLANLVTQLKVVSQATDELQNKVNALYAGPEKAEAESDDAVAAEETKDD